MLKLVDKTDLKSVGHSSYGFDSHSENFTKKIIIMDKEEKAMRFNESKLQWSLVDYKSLEPMVRVLEFGAKKYDIDNWKKGLDTLQVCESLLRHIYAFMDGEDIDPESGESHIGHMMCNTLFLSYTLSNKPNFDIRRRNKIK